ncbi:hypothetical protein Cassandra_0338 [Pseudomonas phage Cassandra]|nr:hypothetical protein Cassandra_0338 [Pseudomonas phage Cassandra]
MTTLSLMLSSNYLMITTSISTSYYNKGKNK